MHIDTRILLPVLETLECPGDEPGGLVWDGTSFWVADEATGAIYCVDRQTGGVHSELRAPDAGGGTAWDGTCLFQAAPERYRILVLDPAGGRIVRRIPTRVRAAGLAWDGRHLWHGSYSEKRIYMLDAGLGDVRGTIDAPALGCGLAWDGEAFWQCGSSDILHRLNSEGQVLGSCAVEGRPRDLAFDGQHLWYSCARDRQLKKVARPSQ